MKQFIKKFIGEIILTSGIGIFIYGIFNFSSIIYGGTGGLPSPFGESTNMGATYYYHDSTLIMIAISAMFITIGILLIKNRQKKF